MSGVLEQVWAASPATVPVGCGHAGEDVTVLLDRGERALFGEGDLRASRVWFDAAYRRAEDDGDVAGMARAALGLGGLWVHEHRTVMAAASVQARQRHALSLVEPRSALGLRLRARLAGEADYRTGRSAAIRAVLEESASCGDPVARAEALSLAHHCVLGPDDAALRQRLADELIVTSARTSRRADLLMGLLWRTVDLFLAADPHAERGLGQLRELLAQDDHLAVGFVVSAIDVMLAMRAGDLDAAEARAAACMRRGETAGDGDAPGWYGGQMVAIRWYQGRLAELVPMLREMVHSPTLSSVDNSYFAALAAAAACAGDRRTAAGALARLRDLAELPRSSSWLATMYGVVEAAHLLGDARLSASAYRLLLPYAPLPMVASLGVACFGSVRHALGVAALTMGDAGLAAGHLRGAVSDNLALGHWPAAVLSRTRLAKALRLTGSADDLLAAEHELATAAHDAAAIGMPLPEPARDTCGIRGLGDAVGAGALGGTAGIGGAGAFGCTGGTGGLGGAGGLGNVDGLSNPGGLGAGGTSGVDGAGNRSGTRGIGGMGSAYGPHSVGGARGVGGVGGVEGAGYTRGVGGVGDTRGVGDVGGVRGASGTQGIGGADDVGGVDGRVRCRRVGRQWRVTLGERGVLVEDSVGMRHLATLLANPRREIPAVDLAGGGAQPVAVTQPVLDEQARRQYRQRLSRLSAEIDEFEANHDLEHAARARQERDWLLAELAAATGMAGRPREFANDDERARIAVGKAIRRALHRIAQADPVIGEHLQTTVGTGRRCVYQPG